jgi:L-amino acid N-acyltransferase YncA
MDITIREAEPPDAEAIARIYNQGIEERAATFETQPRTADDIAVKLAERERYPILVATDSGAVVIGWAGLSPYRPRAC